MGVRLAYLYYMTLFRKIQRTPAHRVMRGRIGVANGRKFGLLISSYVQHRLNLA